MANEVNIEFKYKKTWFRDVVIFMCENNKMRCKWLLRIMKNYPIGVLYNGNKIIKIYTLKSLLGTF